MSAQNDGDIGIVTIDNVSGRCEAKLPDGRTVTSTVDDGVGDVCDYKVGDGGDNIIVIWPRESPGEACVVHDDGGGINIVVIWPT